MSEEPLGAAAGSHRMGNGSRPVAARITLYGDTVEIRSGVDEASEPIRRIALCEVARVDELAPFDEDPATVEIRLDTDESILASVTRDDIDRLCVALASTVTGNPTDSSVRVRPVRVDGLASRRWRAAAAATAVALVGAVWWHPGLLPTGASEAEISAAPTTTLPPASGAMAVPATTATTAPPPPTTVAVPEPEPEPTDIAPLTGLPAPAAALMRPAIVSKIDASLPAMPQVGMELADVIYEVRIEFGSRYLAVFHSQEPAIVGPHRSARTTDPDLLAMFGHPLFAFSGANDGVVRSLALTNWKTGVGPGEVASAWFRDEQRPWPHNLFARTASLRTRKAPLVTPPPLFTFHTAETAPVGVPIEGFMTDPGVQVEFRWDAALGGWRRRIWNQDHMHANGEPVAPTNVVVVETAYRTSHADVRSPEAISVGTGRAWVFTRGQVRQGTWTRWQRTDPWNLVDATGAPLTLDPGTTWVVLAEGRPQPLGGA